MIVFQRKLSSPDVSPDPNLIVPLSIISEIFWTNLRIHTACIRFRVLMKHRKGKGRSKSFVYEDPWKCSCIPFLSSVIRMSLFTFSRVINSLYPYDVLEFSRKDSQEPSRIGIEWHCSRRDVRSRITSSGIRNLQRWNRPSPAVGSAITSGGIQHRHAAAITFRVEARESLPERYLVHDGDSDGGSDGGSSSTVNGHSWTQPLTCIDARSPKVNLGISCISRSNFLIEKNLVRNKVQLWRCGPFWLYVHNSEKMKN